MFPKRTVACVLHQQAPLPDSRRKVLDKEPIAFWIEPMGPREKSMETFPHLERTSSVNLSTDRIQFSPFSFSLATRTLSLEEDFLSRIWEIEDFSSVRTVRSNPNRAVRTQPSNSPNCVTPELELLYQSCFSCI